MKRNLLLGIAVGGLAVFLLAGPAQAQFRYRYSGPYLGAFYTPYYNAYSGLYGSPYVYGSSLYTPYYGGNYYYTPYVSGTWYNTFPNYVGTYVYSSYPAWSGTTYSNPPVYGGTYISPPVSYNIAANQVRTTVPANYQSYYAGPSVEADKARVRVIVPTPDAQLVVEGQQMASTGLDRSFISPSLQTGGTYNYTIRATWRAGDREVSREKQVTVRPGQETVVQFTAAEGVPTS
jgi:uncharacterized protein (TIGR03000 family)